MATDKYLQAVRNNDFSNLLSPVLPNRTATANSSKTSVDVAGLKLPLDTRYLANPENPYTYNSFADAVLNTSAAHRRYHNTAGEWLDPLDASGNLKPEAALSFIPRTIVDSVRLLYDTTVAPVVKNVQEDGWGGLGRGLTTAGFNTLVNLGDTADVLNNITKGVLFQISDELTNHNSTKSKDLWTRIQESSIGTLDGGRKRFNWDLVPNAESALELVGNTALDLLSDPFTWMSLGASGLLRKGGQSVAQLGQETAEQTAKTATKQLRAASREFLTEQAVKNSSKTALDATLETSARRIKSRAKAIIQNVDESTVKNLPWAVRQALKHPNPRATVDGVYDLATDVTTRITSPEFFRSASKKELRALLRDSNTPEPLRAALRERVQDIVTTTLQTSLPRTMQIGKTLYAAQDAAQAALTKAAALTGIGAPIYGVAKVVTPLRNGIQTAKQLRRISGKIADTAAEQEFTDALLAPVAAATDNLMDPVSTATQAVYESTFTKQIAALRRALKNTDVDKGQICKQWRQNTADLLNKQIQQSTPFQNLDELIKHYQGLTTRSKRDRTLLQSAKSMRDILDTTQPAEMANAWLKEVQNTGWSLENKLREYLSPQAYQTYQARLASGVSQPQALTDTILSVIPQKSRTTKRVAEITKDPEQYLTDAILRRNKQGLQHAAVAIKGMPSADAVARTVEDTLRALSGSEDAQEQLLSLREFMTQLYDDFMERFGGKEATYYNAEQYGELLRETLDTIDQALADTSARNMPHATYQDWLDTLSEVERQQLSDPTEWADTLQQVSQRVRQIQTALQQLRNTTIESTDMLALRQQLATLQKTQTSWQAASTVLDFIRHMAEHPEENFFARTSQQELARALRDMGTDAYEAAPLKEIISDLLEYRTTYLQTHADAPATENMRHLKQAAQAYLQDADDYRYAQQLVMDWEQHRRTDLSTQLQQVQEALTQAANAAEQQQRRAARDAQIADLTAELTGLQAQQTLLETAQQRYQTAAAVAQAETASVETANSILTYFTSKLVGEYTPLIQNDMVRTLQEAYKLFQKPQTSGTQNIADMLSRRMVMYQVMTSKKAMLSMLLEGTAGGFPAAHPAFANLISEYRQHGDIYTILHDTSVLSKHPGARQKLLNMFDAYAAYQTFQTNLRQTLQQTMTPMQVEAVFDALAGMQHTSRYACSGDQLDGFVSEVLRKANQNITTQTQVDRQSMDYMLRTTATRVWNDPTASAEHKQIAEDIINSLTQGTAHAGDTDVQNMVRLCELVPEFKQKLNRGQTIVWIDIENTGFEKSGEVYQIALYGLRPDGTVLQSATGTPLTFNIKAKRMPPKLLLDTVLAPDGVANPSQWFRETFMHNPDLYPDLQTAMLSVVDTLRSFDNNAVLYGHNIDAFDIPKLAKGNSDIYHFETFDTLPLAQRLDGIPTFRMEFYAAQVSELLQQYLDDTAALDLKRFGYTSTRVDGDYLKTLQSELYPARTRKTTKRFRQSTAPEDMVRSSADLDNSLNTVYHTPITDGIDDYFEILKEFRQSGRSLTTKSGDDASNYLYRATKDYMSDEAWQITRSPDGKLLSVGYNPCDVIDQPHTGDAIGGRHNAVQMYIQGQPNALYSLRTAASYEIFNLFDPDAMRAIYGENVPLDVLMRAETLYKPVSHLAQTLSGTAIAKHYDAARAFLQHLPTNLAEEAKFLQALRPATTAGLSEAETVALAMYLSQAYRYTRDLPELAVYKAPLSFAEVFHFQTQTQVQQGTADQIVENVRRVVDNTPTLDVSQLAASLQPQENPFARMLRAYQDEELYGVYQQTRAAQMGKARGILKRLQQQPVTNQDVQRLASYDKRLAQHAVTSFLQRPDRVQAFLEEAPYTAGRKLLYSTEVLDVSDFADAGVIVRTVKYTDQFRDGYLYFFCVPAERMQLFTQTEQAGKLVDVFDMNALCDKAPMYLEPTTTMDTVATECRKIINDCCVGLGDGDGTLITAERMQSFDELLRQYAPDVVDQLTAIDTLDNAGFFDHMICDHLVLGDYGVQRLTDDRHTYDVVRRMCSNLNTEYSTQLDELTKYVTFCCTEANGLRTSGLFNTFENNPRELMKLFQQQDEMVVVYVRTPRNVYEKTKSGYILERIPMTTQTQVQLAFTHNAHVIPKDTYLQMATSINNFEVPKWCRMISQISNAYKMGYLTSIGFVIRNFLDSNYKNRIALDDPLNLPQQLRAFFKTAQAYKQYTQLIQLTGHDLFNKTVVNMTQSEYRVFYTLITGTTKDFTEAVELYLSRHTTKHAQEFIDILRNATPDFIQTCRVQFPTLMEPELFNAIHKFITEGPSGGLVRAITEDAAQTLPKGLFNTLRDLPGFKQINSANGWVEQTARLSLYLQMLERGADINTAVRKVIKTHFDYSDKSLLQLYTEMIFPFMSFSFKNLEFWLTELQQRGWLGGEMGRLVRELLNYDNLVEPDYEKYENYDYSWDWDSILSFNAQAPWAEINAARLYHALVGNIVLDKIEGVPYTTSKGTSMTADLYTVFKLSPSFLDAVNLITNPLDTYAERMLPPYEQAVGILKNALKGEPADFSAATLLNNLPFLDTLLQRTGTTFESTAEHPLEFTVKRNNVLKRIQDAGMPQALLSLMSGFYIPQYSKYSSKVKYSGGFIPNYYHRQLMAVYSPTHYDENYKHIDYQRDVLARNGRVRKALYTPSGLNRMKLAQYNTWSTTAFRRKMYLYRLKSNYYYYK